MLTDVLNERTLPYVATIAALGAWWVSWREARRSNRVVLKLSRLRSSFTEDATGMAYKLEVLIVNEGIQIQDISLGLVFLGQGKSGSISVPIPLSAQSKGVSSAFLRGTTAKFVLSTADKDLVTFVGHLRDFDQQRPVINVYNTSFLACSFPVYSRWDGLRKQWNRTSYRLAYTRRVGDGYDGKGVFKTYQLPHFLIRSENLRSFLDGLRSLDDLNKVPPDKQTTS